MNVHGTALLEPAPSAVKAVLGEPERLVAALPNVDEFGWDTDEDGTFTATIRPAIALGEVPVATRWSALAAEELAARYRVEGRAGEHQIEFDVSLSLTADGDGTRVDWSLDYVVRGTMRSVGQRVLGAVIDAQARLVVDAVGREAASQ